MTTKPQSSTSFCYGKLKKLSDSQQNYINIVIYLTKSIVNQNSQISGFSVNSRRVKISDKEKIGPQKFA